MHGPTPPLSPVLLAGLLARPLPPALLQPALDAALARVVRRHPQLFERLSDIANPVFVIDPLDLPLVFVLSANAERPRVVACHDAEGHAPVAYIRGGAMALLELLQGRTDGDTLFFSRALVIDGDTEAVVALRNALDGAEIDLFDDFVSALGPLSVVFRGMAKVAHGVYGHVSDDLAAVQQAMVAPMQNALARQSEKLAALEAKVASLGKPGHSVRRKAAGGGE